MKRFNIIKLLAMLVVFDCSLTLCSAGGLMFNFYLLHDEERNREENEEVCKDLGYEGLAVVNSPEAYAYALRIRGQDSLGVFIGLARITEDEDLVWDDGTPVASDTPWDKPDGTGLYGRIKSNNDFSLGGGFGIKYALCGNHKNLPTEAWGSTLLGQKPGDVTSTLFEQSAPSYLSCVMFCGQDNRCRAAVFNLVSLRCRLLGPGSFGSPTPNSDYNTFLRIGYTS